jgi:hypothetical protein
VSFQQKKITSSLKYIFQLKNTLKQYPTLSQIGGGGGWRFVWRFSQAT